MSIEFDHWLDGSKKSLLGVIIIRQDGKRYLVDFKDESLNGHSSKAIVKSLEESLKRIPAQKINSIESDSAPSCKKARESFVKLSRFRHILPHRCLAHLFNLIGKAFSEVECVNDLMEFANKLAAYFSSNPAFVAKLTALGKRRVTKATAVRWYSNVDMLESLIDVRDEALVHVNDERSENSLLLHDDAFWIGVSAVSRIMRPLANCITIAEKADGSVGEAIQAILCYAKSIFESDWNDKYTIAAVISFLSYFNFAKLDQRELGLFLTAYYFDKRFKMDWVTKEGVGLVAETLADLVIISNVSVELIDSVLTREFRDYRNQVRPFNKHQAPE